MKYGLSPRKFPRAQPKPTGVINPFWNQLLAMKHKKVTYSETNY